MFVGQRKDPFVVNLGETFDLVNLKPASGTGGRRADTLRQERDSLVLEVPIACLTAASGPIIGGWTTASLPRAGRHGSATLRAASTTATAPVQVSRLGMPLVNEVVIGLKDKNRFNASEPKDDGQFADYVTNPTLPELLEVLFGVAAPNLFPRTDLVAAFLTGIEGLNDNGASSEMMRLNTSSPHGAGEQNNLGVLGGDNAGFPNGRRPGDDVVDIELRVAMGVLLDAGAAPSGQLPFTDGAALKATDFQKVFPYLNTPFAGSPSSLVRSPRFPLLAVALCLLPCATASAHDFWIEPASHLPGRPGSILRARLFVAATPGEGALRPQPRARGLVRARGRRGAARGRSGGPARTRRASCASSARAASCWATAPTPPRSRCRPRSSRPTCARRGWSAPCTSGAPSAASRLSPGASPTRCAEALLRTAGAEPGAPDLVLGFPLELVLLSDPYARPVDAEGQAGPLVLRLELRGAPLPGALIHFERLDPPAAEAAAALPLPAFHRRARRGRPAASPGGALARDRSPCRWSATTPPSTTHGAAPGLPSPSRRRPPPRRRRSPWRPTGASPVQDSAAP